MGVMRDFAPLWSGLVGNAFRFDVHSRRVQIGRSIVALAELMTLLATSWPNLTTTVAGRPAEQYCLGPRAVTVFCVGGGGTPVESGRWVAVAVLVLVVAGVFPPVVSVLHAWVAVSMQVSLSLPDGGEAVAAFTTALAVPLAFADRRAIAWLPRPRRAGPHMAAIGYAASLALCVQLAGIYLESGLSKLAEPDWVNGTALFYDIRDPSFGASGITGEWLRALTGQPWGTAAMTWGTIVAECLIGIGMLSAARFKKYALAAVVVLHFGILVALGLWSFAMIMIGTAVIAAYTFPAQDRTTGSGPLVLEPVEDRSLHVMEEAG